MSKALLAIAICLFSYGLLLFVPPEIQARDYLDLTADTRTIPTAVPYFINKKTGLSDLTGKKFALILGRSLAFHGFLSIIDPDKYGGMQSTDWQALGAEFAVIGQYEQRGDKIVFELRLLEIQNGQVITGKRYIGLAKDSKLILFKFCDEVIYKLTGEQGVALSLISFVGNSSGKKEIYVSDILGEDIRQVTKHHYLAVSPRFSPNAHKLAYTSYHRGNPNLYITDLSQTTTRCISWRPGLNLAPAFSPDGSRMIFTMSKNGESDLYLAKANAPARQEVTILGQLTRHSGLNVSPTWSPDGKEVAFVSDRGGSPQIYVMDMGTKHVRRLTFEGNYNTSPSWSPKGDLIAYAGQAGGVYQLFTIAAKGDTPATQITNSWGSYESPSWSPDGRQIVFSRKRNDKQ
ncbi:MAG: protein TolB, partial [Deltaproteobacteria bacterium]